MTKLQAEVILALADNGLKVNTAARKIYRHKNTLDYHIRAVKKDTGLNPLDFWDMQKLVPVAKKVLDEMDHKKGE